MRHRSWRDHRMYWAMMRRAFDNWPKTHRFKPTSPEHLHGWILIETGNDQSAEVETDNVDVAKAVAKAIYGLAEREVHCMRIFESGPGVLRISIPKPFNGADAGKRQYEMIRASVYEYIEHVLGVPIASIKRARVAE